MLLRTQFQKQIYDFIYSLANHINYCCSWLHVTLYFCTKYVNLILLNFAEFFLPDIITMAYFLCKLKICIYVYTVGICSYILPSINAMVNQNTDIKKKICENLLLNFIFVYCYSRTVFLVLTDCFGVHWSIEKFARTDDKFFWLFRYIFSRFIIITSSFEKKKIPFTVDVTWWCIFLWCPLSFQYVWTTKESVLWITCIKRYPNL